MTPDQLRQLADDMEQRPDEECWQWVNCSYGSRNWWDCTPENALVMGMRDYIKIRRKPRTRKVEIEVPESVPNEVKDGGLLWLLQSDAKASTRINYPTKEDAKAAYAAIVKALGGGE